MNKRMEKFSPNKEDIIEEEEEMDPVEIEPGVDEKQLVVKMPDIKINNGYIEKLERKIQELAARLHEQESYRLLCEQKLQELAPGHPLPIEPSHLGKNVVPSTATEKSRYQSDQITLKKQIQEKDKKILALEQEISKIQSEKQGVIDSQAHKNRRMTEEENQNELAGKTILLEKEKTALEESLRSEVLANEEQRNYIEILKEALETKIADLGLDTILAKSQITERIHKKHIICYNYKK